MKKKFIYVVNYCKGREFWFASTRAYKTWQNAHEMAEEAKETWNCNYVISKVIL